MVAEGAAEVVILVADDAEVAEDAVERLASSGGAPGLPILVVAQTTSTERAGLLRSGASDVIPTPTVVEEVVLRADRAVAAFRAGTDRDAALAAASLAGQQLENFAYTASHDLKEPLRAVSGFATLLEQRYGEVLEGDGRTYLRFILDGTDRLASMIGGLLELSRITRHEIVLDDVDVAETLEAAITQLGTESLLDGATIDVDLPSVTTIRTDWKLLQVCLIQLLSNALTFVAEDQSPVVSITATADDRWVSVTVADRGLGIRTGDLDRVFDLFTRLHARERYPGHGIGLGIVALAVRRLGGDVTITSQVGEGTTVTLRLPA